MSKPAKVESENFGKPSYQMLGFFQRMVQNGDVSAYYSEDLAPVKELREDTSYFLKDPKTGTMYKLEVESHGGMLTEDGSQAMFHNCNLERLDQTNHKQVTGSLHVNYEEDWEAGDDTDFVAGARGRLKIEGESDSLFEKVREFVKK